VLVADYLFGRLLLLLLESGELEEPLLPWPLMLDPEVPRAEERSTPK